MTRLLKSSFIWQFAGGFLIGAIGLFALQPVMNPAPQTPVTATATR